MSNPKLYGLNNKLTVKDNKVHKLSNPIVDYFIDRKNEVEFCQAIVNLDLDFLVTPLQFGFKKSGNFESVFPYYANSTTFTNVQKWTLQTFAKVIKLIENVHALDIQLKLFDPKKFLKKFTTKVSPIFELEPYKEQVEEIINTYYDDGKNVVSHNDLVRGNFLKIGKTIKLIDFEFVNRNHYLFDYASFASESCNFKDGMKFLKQCNFNQLEMEKVIKLIIFQNYLWTYWAKYMYLKTGKKIYHEIMADKMNKMTEWTKDQKNLK